jgi:hypothetical protein
MTLIEGQKLKHQAEVNVPASTVFTAFTFTASIASFPATAATSTPFSCVFAVP